MFGLSIKIEFSLGDLTRPFHFAECSTPECNFVHCEDCWIDIGEICLPCQKYYENQDQDEGNYSEYYKTDVSDWL